MVPSTIVGFISVWTFSQLSFMVKQGRRVCSRHIYIHLFSLWLLETLFLFYVGRQLLILSGGIALGCITTQATFQSKECILPLSTKNIIDYVLDIILYNRHIFHYRWDSDIRTQQEE